MGHYRRPVLEDFYFLPFLFFLVAVLYSSAGFAGGSGYIALMALFSIPYQVIPPVALVCNMVVTSANIIRFWRRGNLDLKFLFPFAVLSIPCSYLGGSMAVAKPLFQIILATLLFIIGIKMLFLEKKEALAALQEFACKHFFVAGILGGIFGLLAGLTGVGGGMFLVVALYGLGWGTAKKIAATASAFIFINSFFGLIGHLQKLPNWGQILNFYPLYLSVLAGGQLGSWLCHFRISESRMQKLTAVLVLLVSGKLIVKALLLS